MIPVKTIVFIVGIEGAIFQENLHNMYEEFTYFLTFLVS